MNYKVEITETNSKILNIEAESEEDAIDIAIEKYKDDNEIMDDESIFNTEFEIYKDE